jgi:hypothetical protein
MRIRVRVDIRQPLKKDSRVKNQGGNWCTVNFKYEKLGVFCFVCGLIGHGENRCAVRFAMTEDDGSRAWSKELRAEPRRRSGRQTSRWLTEEDGGRVVHREGQTHGFSGEQPSNTCHTNSAETSNSSRPRANLQSLPCPPFVPSFISSRQDLVHIPFSLPIDRPTITASTEFGASQPSHGNVITHQSTISHQPLLTINAPDKHLITHSLPIINQSLPHHSQPIPSYSLSPIITDALKTIPSNHFSFTATSGPTPKQPINPITNSVKSNPAHKLTRTGPTRTRTKHDPTKPDPTQNLTAAMEVQTEKKRRRDIEKEKEDDATVIQHFLTAGPGSQDCRDQ